MQKLEENKFRCSRKVQNKENFQTLSYSHRNMSKPQKIKRAKKYFKVLLTSLSEHKDYSSKKHSASDHVLNAQKRAMMKKFLAQKANDN